MTSFRELIGNTKFGNASSHIASAGSLVIDPATGNVYVHDGVTAGGTQIGNNATSVHGANSFTTADAQSVIVIGGNNEGSAGRGGTVYIYGGSTLGTSTATGGDVIINAGGGGEGPAGSVYISGGDGVGGGHLFLFHLPLSDPHIIGAVWNSSGTLMISAG